MAGLRIITPESSAWDNRDLVLYHGTINRFEESILRSINIKVGMPDRDFGRGFYTTTSLIQAQVWSWRTSQNNPGSLPAVISLAVDRESLAKLASLWFVRGSSAANDYWDLVQRCRTLGTDHGRAVNRGWYDVVVGPVAREWETRDAYPDADQISFHTPRAARLLNISSKRVLT